MDKREPSETWKLSVMQKGGGDKNCKPTRASLQTTAQSYLGVRESARILKKVFYVASATQTIHAS